MVNNKPIMKLYQLILLYLCSTFNGFAQTDTLLKREIRNITIQEGPRYSNNQIQAYLNDYPTNMDILRLFKAGEISLERSFDPKIPAGTLKMNIQVADTAHPVFNYVKHKADIIYEGKRLMYPELPEVTNRQIKNRIYHDWNHNMDSLKNTLELTISYAAEDVNAPSTRFRTNSRSINWFEVNGNILSEENFRKKAYQPDEIKSTKTIFGKEAFEKYKDPKYISGIRIIQLKSGIDPDRPRPPNQRILWYDVDGIIVHVDDLRSQNLTIGTFKHGPIIDGDYAVSKYGDEKYRTGVQVINRNK